MSGRSNDLLRTAGLVLLLIGLHVSLPATTVAQGLKRPGARHGQRLAARETPSPQRWPDERQSGVFFCHSDHSLVPYQQTIDRLGVLQLDLQRVLEIEAPRERVHLFLFEHPETYAAYVRMYFPDAPSRRALYVKQGRGPGMVFAAMSKEIEVDLRHEGTHALLHSVLPMVPLWLDEGLAEYFEQPEANRRNSSPHLSKVRWNVRFRNFQSIESLESLERLEQMGLREYRNAWAWVHFMLHGPEPAREVLRAYLQDIQSHTAPGVLSERLKRRIPNLQQRFVAHFANWSERQTP